MKTKFEMSDSELKARLLKGLDIDYQGVVIRNYSIGEIIEDLGLDRYYYLAGLTTVEVKDLVKANNPEDIDKLTVYGLFCNEFRATFIDFLNTFTYLQWEYVSIKEFVAYEDNDRKKKRYRINLNNFEGLMKLIKKMYVINRGEKKNELDIDPIMATSKEAKALAEFFLEPDEKTDKNDSKSGITLNGVINGLISKGVGYNYSNIWDLKMYQLMSLYYGVIRDEDYQNVITSVYHGVWDTKKNPVNFNNIHWSKEVNI